MSDPDKLALKRERRKRRRQERAASHPGGTGAVMGARMIRYSGVQGASLVAASVLQLVTMFVIAHFLGAADLAVYSLLIFLASLIAHVLNILAKPGTIRRTFGAGDEDEGDDEEPDEDVSGSPQRSLGTGLLLTAVLGLLAAAIVAIASVPIAELLLDDGADSTLVIWAGVLGAALAMARLAAIILWLERRPGAFVAADTLRPALALVITTVVLIGGGGVEGAIAGAAVGAIAGSIVGLFLLRGSHEVAVDVREAGRIMHRSGQRSPLLTSYWIAQNADIFLLSLFVTDSDLGVYALASRLGFVVAFLPQGFRLAMRPLRKGAMFHAVREQYGPAVQNGQILGYFVLICVTSILLMVLGGRILIEIAPDDFSNAGPLIAMTAAAMIGPSLLRTVAQQTSWPGRGRRTIILTAIAAALIFIAVTVLLAPSIGVYAAPVGMVAGFWVTSAYLFVRGQRGPNRIEFPYAEVLKAIVIAGAIGALFYLLPDMSLGVELAIAVVLALAYFPLLFLLRVIPEAHWPALAHMARSTVSGRTDDFNPRRGLRVLAPAERDDLRAAVGRLDAERLRSGEVDGERLVKLLRRVGEGGGATMRSATRHDGEVAYIVFSDEPAAARDARMRALLADGAEPNDLRQLEDLAGHLARVPADAWAGTGAREPGSRRLARRVIAPGTRTRGEG